MRRLAESGSYRRAFIGALAFMFLALPARASFNPIMFATDALTAITQAPELVAAGDFNGDGRIDAAALSVGSDAVTILLRQEDGTLGTGADAPIGTRLEQFTVGDIDGDGTLDIAAVTNFNDLVYLALGIGNGSFRTAAKFDVGRHPVDVAIGDFDGVNKRDLVSVNYDEDTISVLLNSGSSLAYREARTFPVGNRPRRVVTADLNGDGLDDLVVLNTGGLDNDTVSVLLNSGNGVFKRQVTYKVGFRSKDLAIADLNNDLAPDILVLSGKSVSGRSSTFPVSVLINRIEEVDGHTSATGIFDPLPDFNAGCPAEINGIPIFCNPNRIATADYDLDGIIDFVISFQTLTPGQGTIITPGVLVAYTGLGNGEFSSNSQASVGLRPVGIATADFNKDAVPDLVVAEEGDRTIRIVTIRAPDRREIGMPCNGNTQCASLACVDGVCCAMAPCGRGEACNLPGTEGHCTSLLTPTPSATPTETPPGLADGGQCSDPSQCDSENCVDLVCCAVPECPPDEACNVPGQEGHCSAVAIPTATPSESPTPTEITTPVPTRTSGEIVCPESGCSCAGDCDGNQHATVDELVTLVNIALGTVPLTACPAGEADPDGQITIDELLAASSNVLNGCPPPSPGP